MALVVAQEVPTSSTMTLPHGPAVVGAVRRRLRGELTAQAVPDVVIDDAVLIISELVSNSCRHARPLDVPAPDGDGGEPGRHVPGIVVRWFVAEDGLLALEVTDGGGPTRPRPSRPSVTAHGGRGLSIVDQLALRWGVRDHPGEVTVWALLPVRARHARRQGLSGGFVGDFGVSPVAAACRPTTDFDDAFD
ncbi:hypothetical protein AQ490_26500 [Wenjunlia vitaminophila]|uniref:Histidine kinase/HSP90-like ATPase domain-containing protein n=1 Tax=Wenjunlia vitaminophila TaxID=76728 RepID=A0A0T6LPT7_WENVI|nr:ATP-binding protein [Wenjunlia vitaminophila]KRV48093.1 hypothetical protein AQ490_26500 [Wenjunlia vitaminophila]